MLRVPIGSHLGPVVCPVIANIQPYRVILPTKDETSETIVQNLYCLFPYIHDSLQFPWDRHI